ncbi:Adducin-related protein C1289.14 [Chionoecetes opilio]|uniref:Adducin-related protein C1289.14 n=1 Tax=Chionoecetes opilio TaxID=41210 RepID=A0A8J4YHV8_CHIOP|nr:Adducin-related protein C1289.14 [Chionoecetes opilio]
MSGLRGVMLAKAAAGQGRFLTRAFTHTFPKPYTVPEGPWGSNKAARLELAAAYRGLDQLGLNEGVCNHLSMMAPYADGQGKAMLVISYGLHWSEVTASNLLGLNERAEVVEGEGHVDVTASCIHLGIRQVRPDATVILHTHQPYATARSLPLDLHPGCMKDPTLLMVHQNSTRFYKRVAYDTNYSGLALAMDEGKRLGEALGDKDILIMGHHGVLSVANSVAVAFEHLYYLERAAQLQVCCTAISFRLNTDALTFRGSLVPARLFHAGLPRVERLWVLALSMQREVDIIPEESCKLTSDAFWKDIQGYSEAHFHSMYRRLRTTQPDFEL